MPVTDSIHTAETIAPTPTHTTSPEATPKAAAPLVGPDPGDSVLMQRALHARGLELDSLAICRVPAAKDTIIEKATPPPPPAWTTGMEPRPLPPGAKSDLPAFIGVGVVIAIVSLSRGAHLFSSIVHDLRPGARTGRRYDERDVSDRWCLAGIYALLIICSAILLSKFVTYIHPEAAGIDTVDVLYLTFAMCGYYLFKLFGYNIAGYAFGDTTQRAAWLRAYNATQMPLALALIVPVTLVVFDPLAVSEAMIVAAALVVVARIAFFVKGFSIFYINISSPFYFILYLCTLEITPIIVLYSCALKIVSVGT